jgi:tetraacyldisaccharide 4'-kinase
VSPLNLTKSNLKLIMWIMFPVTFPLMILYSILVRWRRSNISTKRTAELPGKVVSVGNLYVGGTGKTPTTIALIEHLKSRGKKVVVLSRGYKSGLIDSQFGLYKENDMLLSDESSLTGICADEAKLVHTVTNVPSVFGVNRVEAAKWYLQSNPLPDVWVLDDGFQHLPLNRDVDLLLFDYNVDLRKEMLFPLGFLREPLSFAKFAQMICFTKTNQPNSIPSWANKVFAKYVNQDLMYVIKEVDEGFVEKFIDGKENNVELEDVGKCSLVTGIASPEKLEKNLKSHKLEILNSYFVGDHAPFNAERLAQLGTNCPTVVTTDKDYARASRSLHACFQRVIIKRISFDLGEKFKSDLNKQLNI